MIDQTSHSHLIHPCAVNVDFKEILFHLDQHRSMQHYTAAMLLQRKKQRALLCSEHFCPSSLHIY